MLNWLFSSNISMSEENNSSERRGTMQSSVASWLDMATLLTFSSTTTGNIASAYAGQKLLFKIKTLSLKGSSVCVWPDPPVKKIPCTTGNLHPLSPIAPPCRRKGKSKLAPTPIKEISKIFTKTGRTFLLGGILPGVGKNKDRCPPVEAEKSAPSPKKSHSPAKCPPSPTRAGKGYHPSWVPLG